MKYIFCPDNISQATRMHEMHIEKSYIIGEIGLNWVIRYGGKCRIFQKFGPSTLYCVPG